jgi:hypothetical protein
MPRRLAASAGDADAMSSVTISWRASIPSACSRSPAIPKFMTAPA